MGTVNRIDFEQLVKRVKLLEEDLEKKNTRISELVREVDLLKEGRVNTA